MRALVLSLALVSCATLPSKNNLEDLKEAVEAYNHFFRWKSYDQAAVFVPADVREAFLATYDQQEGLLNVEDSEILRLRMGDNSRAVATVRVRYSMLPSVTVQVKTLTQHWHKIDEQWILETEDNPICALEKKKQEDPADYDFGGRKDEGLPTWSEQPADDLLEEPTPSTP